MIIAKPAICKGYFAKKGSVTCFLSFRWRYGYHVSLIYIGCSVAKIFVPVGFEFGTPPWLLWIRYTDGCTDVK